MTDTKFLGTAAMVVAFLIAAAIVLSGTQSTFASAPSGLEASVASTSQLNVAATSVITLMASSSCTARIVTTSASPVMLTFSDYAGQTPTGSFGHLQAASTTVAYDGGIYGCGKVKAYSYSAQVLTFSSVR